MVVSLLLIFGSALSIAADSPRSESQGAVGYRVARVTFMIVGMTRQQAVGAVTGIRVGQYFATHSELDFRLARAAQDLRNRRIFETVEIVWQPIEMEPDAPSAPEIARPVPIEVQITLEDGWTLIPVVFYRYNSNRGHNPFAVFYWDNIFGTLTDFGFSAGYNTRNWTDLFSWDVQLRWQRLRFAGREWNFSYLHLFETTERANDQGAVEFAYTSYRTQTSLSTSTSITDWLGYAVAPRVRFDYGFRPAVNTIGAALPRNSNSYGFAHALSTGRVDWVGNYRRGWSATLSHEIDYEPTSTFLSTAVYAAAARHWLIAGLNPAVNAQGRFFFDGDRLNQGDAMRGVADNRVYGQLVVAGGAQVTIELIDLPRVAALQLIPFIDLGVAKKAGVPWRGTDAAYGTGVDVVIYPYFFRGLTARLSIGVDLRQPPRDPLSLDNYEFVIVQSLQF